MPGVKLMWAKLAEQSDKEGWPAARFLAALAEHEMADRGRRRIERHLAEARLPAGKTLATFDFDSRADGLEGPGDGARVGRRLAGARAPTSCCSARPAAARAISRQPSGSHWSRTAGACCSPAPPISCNGSRSRGASWRSKAAIAKLDRYDLLILDDIAYVTKDQAETSVLFELIAARYERRSMLITANQPFGEWGKIFPDQAMTLAAIDRLVHHATILEMNVESYRRREALDRKRGRGRPARPRDNQENRERRRLIDAHRQSKRLPTSAASDQSSIRSAASSHPD